MTDTYRAKRVSLQVWITPEQREVLKIAAARARISVTELVRKAIEEELAKDQYNVTITQRYNLPEVMTPTEYLERLAKIDKP